MLGSHRFDVDMSEQCRFTDGWIIPSVLLRRAAGQIVRLAVGNPSHGLLAVISALHKFFAKTIKQGWMCHRDMSTDIVDWVGEPESKKMSP